VKVYITSVVISIVISILCGCTRNVSYVKKHANRAAKDLGFKIIGYEGYQWDPCFGGRVYYTLVRLNSNDKTIYDAGFVYAPIAKEINIYNLRAINAVSTNNK